MEVVHREILAGWAQVGLINQVIARHLRRPVQSGDYDAGRADS